MTIEWLCREGRIERRGRRGGQAGPFPLQWVVGRAISVGHHVGRPLSNASLRSWVVGARGPHFLALSSWAAGVFQGGRLGWGSARREASGCARRLLEGSGCTGIGCVSLDRCMTGPPHPSIEAEGTGRCRRQGRGWGAAGGKGGDGALQAAREGMGRSRRQGLLASAREGSN